jgi:hypothetical protein
VTDCTQRVQELPRPAVPLASILVPHRCGVAGRSASARPATGAQLSITHGSIITDPSWKIRQTLPSRLCDFTGQLVLERAARDFLVLAVRAPPGLATKIHLLADGRGRPLVLQLAAGNVNDTVMFAPLLAALRVAREPGWAGPATVRTTCWPRDAVVVARHQGAVRRQGLADCGQGGAFEARSVRFNVLRTRTSVAAVRRLPRGCSTARRAHPDPW